MKGVGEKINLLIVMHGAGEGGVEKALKILLKHLDRDAFHPVVALPGDGPMRGYLDSLGIETCITKLDTWTPIPFNFGERHYHSFLAGLKERVNALVELIRKHRIDMVHSATLSVADGAFAARVAGVPHLWHIHGKSVGTTDAYGCYLPIPTLYALVAELSGAVVPVSHDVKSFLGRYLPELPLPVVWNGLDLEEFDASAGAPLSGDQPVPPGDRVVILVGRVAAVKGIDTFIEAAARVLKSRQEVTFLVVGPDEDRTLAAEVKGRVRELGLAEKIIFTGRRNDIPALLRRADISVCSSRTEGFPYSVLEAMAAAKPVLTTRCGGPQEVVLEGETGFQVEVGNPDQLADCIGKLLDDPELSRRLGARGREVLERDFSAGTYAAKFEELYRGLAGSPVAAPNPWGEVALDLFGTLGSLGQRTRQLEHEVRDLRAFEAMFKNNILFRAAKGALRSLSGLLGRKTS